MALTARQVKTALYRLPDADSTITIFDAAQAIYAYRDAKRVALSGGLTPTGALTRALTAYRALGGGLTPSGALTRALTAYRALDGTITPDGALVPVPTYVEALGGTLLLSGALTASNPEWLLIDEDLRWMGEWDEEYSYEADDVVLYKTADGNEWHVFISRAIHNVNNTPTNTPAWWGRLYQEPLA